MLEGEPVLHDRPSPTVTFSWNTQTPVCLESYALGFRSLKIASVQVEPEPPTNVSYGSGASATLHRCIERPETLNEVLRSEPRLS